MQLKNLLRERKHLLREEVGIINTEEKRNYFREFECEFLTSNPNNKELIKGFVSKKAKNKLESYIKDEDKAWAEDIDGETRVYLIKDKSGNIALFFSVKCGLLIGENPKYKLTEDEREFVDILIEAKKEGNEKAREDYYDAGLALYEERVDVLFEIADKRVESKMEAKATGQAENWKVEKCVSAIELRHLCKNEKYEVPDGVGIPLGFGLFWEKIVPFLLGITKQVGCKYIYLFAADKTEEFEVSNVKKLVRYYKNVFKFYECDEDDLIIVKPDYDMDCYGLIQEVSKLEKNRDAVWHEFSDV